MAFKIIEEVKSEQKPVIVSPNREKQLQAKAILFRDHNKDFSSLTGINSKGLYIPKINQLTCEAENPTVTIISDNYFHIDSTKTRKIEGVYGDTWNKIRSFVPIEVESDELEAPYVSIQKNGE